MSSAPSEDENDLISVSRLKILDLVCEGEIAGFWPKSGVSGTNPLVSAYFDDVPVLESDGTANINTSGDGFKFAYKLGASGDGALYNFSKVESSVPLPFSTRLFNPLAGKGDYKSVTISINTTSYPDATSARMTFKVPALFHQKKDGDVKKYQLSYAVDISVNGGPFETVLSNTINGKCTSPYLKSHIISLPRPDSSGQYDWKIRSKRTSENVVNDSKIANDLFLDSVSIISSNTFSYPASAMVGFEFGADQISSVPTRAYDIMGQKVLVPDGYTPTEYYPDGTVKTPAQYPTIWNGTWSATKVWTNNPAWIYYDILINKRYGLGNYFINDWVDKWTLYEIAQYCDDLVSDGSGNTGGTYSGEEPRFTCNVSIQQKQDAFNLINSLSSVFRGIAYWSNGQIIPIQDRLRDPIFNYTNASVENGMFLYSDSARNTRSTVANVKWNDPKNLFREKIEIVEDSEGILKYGYIEKDINAFACTSQGQAHRVGQWLLLTERSLTETISFKVGVEGLTIRPGDVFNVYDNYRTAQKQGGRILETTSSTSIKLDREVNLVSGVNYNLSVVIPQKTYDASGDITSSDQISLFRNSQIETKEVLTSASTTGVLTIPSAFKSGIYDNITGAIWLLNGISQNSGHLYKVSTYKCLNISESEDFKFDILGLQFDSGLYDLMESNFTTNNYLLNTGNGSYPLTPTGLMLNLVTGIENETPVCSILARWSGLDIDNTAYYKISGFYTGQDPKLIGTANNTQFNFYPDTAGTVGVSVAAVNIYNNESNYISGNILIPWTNIFGVPQSSGTYLSEGGSSTTITDSNFTIQWGYTGDNPINSLITESYLNFYNTGISGAFKELVYRQYIPNSGTSFSFNVNTIQNFTGGPIRSFDVIVETLDSFGGVSSGAATRFTNPPPRPPTASGFWASDRSLTYNILPSYLDTDLSGVGIWYSQNPAFIPTFENINIHSMSYGATIPVSLNTGTVDIYFSLIDTLGSLECPIYGPISTNILQNTLNGINAFGYPIISGNAEISGNGVTITQTGNSIIIHGELNNVTGIGISGDLITGGVNLKSVGSITIIRSGQDLIFSGSSDNSNYPSIINFFFQSPSQGSGAAEAIIFKPTTITGYLVCVSGNAVNNISGNFYKTSLDNQNRINLFNFGIPSGLTSQTGIISQSIDSYTKIGIDLLNYGANEVGNLVFATFGYE